MYPFEKLTSNKTPIVITSHPRSGTHLTIDLIRRQFPETLIKKKWGKNELNYLSIEGFKDNSLSEENAINLIKTCSHPIIKLHTYSWDILEQMKPHWMEWIREKGKVIFVARDVRSVMPSMHLYEQSFNPKARCTIKDFIRQTYCGRENRMIYWNEQMLKWFNNSTHLSLRFEDIIKTPDLVCNQITTYTGLKQKIITPYLPPKEKSIWHARFQRIFSTNPPSTAIVGYYKGQKAQKWQQLFDQKDLDFIYQNTGEAMEKLGYIIGK